jgi:hypothetical protein
LAFFLQPNVLVQFFARFCSVLSQKANIRKYFKNLDSRSCSKPGLPDFSWPNHTKVSKYTITNGDKLYQMTVKYSKWS